MKNAFHFAAAALAFAVATPALAQDVGTANFTGLRVEGRFGYEFVSASPRNIQNFQDRGRFGDDSINENVTLGVEAGYDAQFGNFVVGGYANVDFGDSEIEAIGRPYEFKVDRNITAGVRAGTVLRNTLIYAKAGYSNGRLEVTTRTPAAAALFASYDENRNGVHFGGGFETLLLDNFYGRGDYSYTQYEKFRIGTTDDLEFSRHQIMVGVGLRF